MLLDLNPFLIRNEIVPWLDDQSLGRFSRCCKFLHNESKKRLFTQRSLYKIRTKKDFWKINLDRHWKKICPLDKRDYHVVSETPGEFYFPISSEKVKRKIDVIEHITFIAEMYVDDENFGEHEVPKGGKVKMKINIGAQTILTDLFADVERLTHTTFAFHLKFDFPLLLYYLSYFHLSIDTDGFTFPFNNILLPIIQSFIVKGYKIKDQLCNIQETRPCTCGYHNTMDLFIRCNGSGLSTDPLSSWNALSYKDGLMIVLFDPNFISLKILMQRTNYVIPVIPKDD